jgi:hypothetical protein
MQNLVRVELAIHDDGQAAPGELIDDSQHPECLAFMGSIYDEVMGPDMIGPTWSETNTRPIIEP